MKRGNEIPTWGEQTDETHTRLTLKEENYAEKNKDEARQSEATLLK